MKRLSSFSRKPPAVHRVLSFVPGLQWHKLLRFQTSCEITDCYAPAGVNSSYLWKGSSWDKFISKTHTWFSALNLSVNEFPVCTHLFMSAVMMLNQDGCLDFLLLLMASGLTTSKNGEIRI